MPLLRNGCICCSNPSPVLLLSFHHSACTKSPASHLRRRCAFEALMLPRRLAGRLADTLLASWPPTMSLSSRKPICKARADGPNHHLSQTSSAFPRDRSATGHLPSSSPVAIPRPSSNVPLCLVQTEKRPRSDLTIPTLYCGMWQRRNEATKKGESKRRRVSNYCPTQSIVSLPCATHANVLEDGRWWNERMRRAWLL